MEYAFNASELTTALDNSAETKTPLHLLCFDCDRDYIDAFAIDCFNDVAGMDNSSTVLLDA